MRYTATITKVEETTYEFTIDIPDELELTDEALEEKINEALEYEEDNNSDMCTFIETLEDEDFDVTCEDETSSIGFEYEVV